MFRCLVIRHAAAELEAASGRDVDRSLTNTGSEDMRLAVRGLVRVVGPPDLIVTSAYERARATADIIASAFGEVPVEPTEALAAGCRPEAVLALLSQRQGRLVGLVGHEPDLGRFVSLALAGSGRSFYPMHKGEACLIEFPAVPRPGNATLEWAIEARHLSMMGRAPALTDSA